MLYEKQKELKPEIMGFFDTEHGKEYRNSTHMYGDPVSGNSNVTYYRDVFSFVERLKDLAARHGKPAVRDVIYPCLRGRCLGWFTDLGELEKDLLRDASFDQ